jgi:hypothetical protein
MHAKSLFIAAILAWAALPAFAADEPPKADDQSVKLSPLALPIVVDGHVVNYVFVTVKVDLAPSANAMALRDKEPTFRDALVRDAYRTPFVTPGNYNHLDEVRLKAVFMRDATAIAGAGQVRGIEVLNQTAQHFIRPAPPAPAVSH